MKLFDKTFYWIVAGLLAVSLVAGCSTYRASADDTAENIEQQRLALEDASDMTVEKFKQEDSTISHFLDNSHGYAVIPEVTKGGAGIGAAHGEGVVYEDGQLVGYVTMTQGTLGAQLGGQVYSQIMFFEDEMTLQRFKNGNLKLSARASAIAASAGAAADADYERGVAIFTMSRTGLMFEASVGGQQFNYQSKDQAEQASAAALD